MVRGFTGIWLTFLVAGCQQQATTDTPATDEHERIVEAVRDPLLACRTGEFGDTRLRHSHPVVSIALTDDGKQLATATAHEPIVRLWDVASSELINEFRLDAKVPSSFRIVGFSQDGSKLLTFCVCPSPFSHIPAFVPVTIDCRTGAMKNWPWSLFVEGERIPELTILPNGRDVLQRGVDIKIFDLETGVLRKTITASTETWYPLLTAGYSVSPDGTQLASCKRQSGIRIYPLERDDKPRDLSIPTMIDQYRDSSLAWLSNDLLMESHEGNFSIIDPESGKVLTKLEREPNEMVYPVAVTDRAIYVGSIHKNVIRKYDLQTTKRLPVEFECRTVHETTFRNGSPEFGTVSKNDAVIATPVGHTVRLFDARTGQPLHPHVTNSPLKDIIQVRFSRDGARFMATDGRTSQFWDVGSKKILSAYTNDKNFSALFGNWHANVTGPFFSPNGKLLATAREGDGRIVVRDVDGNREVAKEPEWGDIKGSRFQLLDFLDDNTLLAKDGQTGPIVSIRFRDWDVNKKSETSPPAYFLTSSGMAGRIACSNMELTVVSLSDPANVLTVDSHRDRFGTPRCGNSPMPFAMPVRFSNDGRFLTTWDDGFVLWDLKNDAARKVGKLTAQHFGEWYSREASFSPDGKRMIGLLTKVKEHSNKHFHEAINTILIWDTETGKELFRFQPPGGATVAEFHPDGRQLLIAHPNSTFSLWDYATLEKKLAK